MLLVPDFVGVIPKLFLGYAKTRNKAVSLHIFCTKRFIKIIHYCNNRLSVHNNPLNWQNML